MKFKINYFVLLIAMAVFFTACNNADNQEKENVDLKIVSLNGTISEIVCEIGLQDNIVGVDVTSTYPENLTQLPSIGHVRNLSAEGIISLFPTEVLGLKSEIKPDLVQQLENAGVKVTLFELNHSLQGAQDLISDISKHYNIDNEKVKELKENISTQIQSIESYPFVPKVLFIYARGGGNLMVAGKKTSVDKVLEIAQAENAITDFNDFKPLTPEALIKANPDVILMFDKGIESIEGMEGLLKVPGIAETKAGKNKKLITMDGQLLTGFSPRLGLAVKELNQKLNQAISE